MTTLIQNYYTLKANVDNLEKELKSLEGGKKASCARSRKCLQMIKAQSFNMRKDITNYTKTLPTKKRIAKTVAMEIAEPPSDLVKSDKVEVVKPVEPPSDLTKSDKIETVVEKKKKPRKPKEVKLV